MVLDSCMGGCGDPQKMIFDAGFQLLVVGMFIVFVAIALVILLTVLIKFRDKEFSLSIQYLKTAFWIFIVTSLLWASYLFYNIWYIEIRP